MHPEVAVNSPLSVGEICERLQGYGKEWGESKIPPTVRATGIYACRVSVTPPTFRLRLEPQGRGPQLVWIGTVVAADQGSRITMRSEHTAISRASIVALLLFLVIAWWPEVRSMDLWFPFGGALFIGLFVAATTAWRSTAQAPLCAAVLAQVTEARVDVPSRAV